MRSTARHAYGVAKLAISIDALSEKLLETRSPSSEDVPLLYELWQHEEGAVDMVFEPDRDMLDWLSPNPAIRTEVYLRNNEVVGYTRIHTGEPTRPRVFLANDHEAAQAMVVTMNHTLRKDASGADYTLPLHPYSASVQAFGSASATCES